MTGMHDAFLVGIGYVLLRAPGKGDVPEGDAEDTLVAEPLSATS